MQFNQYSLYSFNAGQVQGSCDDKVLVDLQRLKTMKEYDEVKEYVDRTFGTYEGKQKILDYPNDVKVVLLQKENYIGVAGIKDEKQIFGLQWTLKMPEDN